MNIRRKLHNGLHLLRSRFTQNSAILLYHRVAEGTPDPFRLCVSPEHFATHMAAVRELGTPLSIGELVGKQRGGELPKGSISITFDDGCLDILEGALPVLEKFEIPATIYFVSGNLGEAFWWDRLAEIVYPPSRPPARIELHSGDRHLSVETDGIPPGQVFAKLYPYFLALSPAEREEELSALSTTGGCHPRPSPHRSMGSAEIERLSRHPLITIGAHTVHHPRLATLPAAEQLEEISSSIETLGMIAGKPVTTFSYPFGTRSRDYTRQTIQAVQESGLDHALAADLGVVTPRTNPFRLPRLWVHDVDGHAFRRMLRRWL